MNKCLMNLLILSCIAACVGCSSTRVADQSGTHYSVETMLVSAPPLQIAAGRAGTDIQLPDGAQRVRYPTVFLVPGETQQVSNCKSYRSPVGFVNGEITEFEDVSVGQAVRATLNLDDNGQPELSYFVDDSVLLRQDTHVTPSGKKVRLPIVKRWAVESNLKLQWDTWVVLGGLSKSTDTDQSSILIRVNEPTQRPSNKPDARDGL